MVTHRHITRFVRAFALIVFVSSLPACGNNRDWPDRYPTKVKVIYEGKPPVGATIVLTPAGKIGNPSVIPSTGAVAEDGTVTFSTYTLNDGVPAGEYVVSAFWADGSGRSSKQLPAKYLDPATSDHKVRIEKNVNDLGTIELKK
jgi:hypothetical protein